MRLKAAEPQLHQMYMLKLHDIIWKWRRLRSDAAGDAWMSNSEALLFRML